MQQISATQVASISELKKNPTKLINDAAGKPVAILNHNTATAYLIPVETFEKMLDLIDDHALTAIVNQRLSDKQKSIKVNISEL